VVLRGTPDCEACFDFERMVQVLENVLGNAVRFAVRGSTVEIALREGPGTLICSVYNEGPSIPEGELEDIFDRFVQSSKVKNGAGGTGLGLAICRATMSAQGGRIWAQNTLAGVTMHISIPRQRVGLDAGGAASGTGRGRMAVASQGPVAEANPVVDEEPGRRGYVAGTKGLRN
jgi:signal transduction histidine kinase